jgi:hypothetical protein
VHGAFLGAVRSTLRAAYVPVLLLSTTLNQALLDELTASACWRPLFEELVHEIRAALEAVGARALGMDSAEIT